jgi:hypothetical protein
MVRLSFTHMWDETSLVYKKFQDRHYRSAQKGIFVQTIVQKGTLRTTLVDLESVRCERFWESWLTQPLQVEGTSAQALWPAVLRALPQRFRFDLIQELVKLCESVSSFTLQPYGDKASGNLLLMRRFCTFWHEVILPRLGPRVLFWPDTCTVHLHHRGKLQLKGLKHHTARHFSIANLYKQDSVQSRMLSVMEFLISQRLRRVVGRAPAEVHKLSVVVDILFDMEAPHHLRGPDGSRRSQQHQDLQLLARILNGDVLGELQHFCWDESTQKPCCRNREECVSKTTLACVHSLLSRSDPVPAESTWTHLLTNMKKTLLRRLTHEVGLFVFRHQGDCRGGHCRGRRRDCGRACAEGQQHEDPADDGVLREQ